MAQKKNTPPAKQAEPAPTVTQASSQPVSAQKTQPFHQPSESLFSMPNIFLMIAGVALMTAGYLLMIGGATTDPEVFNAEEKYSFTRITLAPILIVAGIFLEVPAIMLRFNKK